MPFNGDTYGDDIVTTITDYTGQNATAHINQITRAVNMENRKIWAEIFDSYGGWRYDSSNYGTLPSATTDLINSQTKYSIPDDTLTVSRLEYKDQGGNWQVLKPITLEEITQYQAENDFYETTGTPLFYRLTSNVIELYPAPNYSSNGGLRIFINRGSVDFNPTDTTRTVGFANEYVDVLILGASLNIGVQKSLKNTQLIADRYQDRLRDMKLYYKSRFEELNPSLHTNYKEDYSNWLI